MGMDTTDCDLVPKRRSDPPLLMLVESALSLSPLSIRLPRSVGGRDAADSIRARPGQVRPTQVSSTPRSRPASSEATANTGRSSGRLSDSTRADRVALVPRELSDTD